jgi:hypothetical protein
MANFPSVFGVSITAALLYGCGSSAPAGSFKCENGSVLSEKLSAAKDSVELNIDGAIYNLKIMGDDIERGRYTTDKGINPGMVMVWQRETEEYAVIAENSPDGAEEKQVTTCERVK